MRHFWFSIIFLSLFSCQQQKESQKATLSNLGTCTSEEGSGNLEKGIFVLNGKSMTRADLPTQSREALFQIEYESYAKAQSLLQEYALRIHLAKKKGVLKDPKNPPPLEQVLPMPKISDRELKKVFEENKKRMPPNTTFAQVKPQIEQFLGRQKMGEVFRAEIEKLEKSGNFVSLLKAPVGPSIELALKDLPVKGKKDATIKVLEISDYKCGHCQAAQPDVIKLFKKYKDRVSFTQVNFSLRPSGISGTYVRGGFCAQAQGVNSFWTYHDKAFEQTSMPHDHSKHGEDGRSQAALEEVYKVAKESKLNMEKFKKCLNSTDAFNYVERIGLEMKRVGVSGTPVFIVNNKKLPRGVLDLEKAILESL